MSFIKNLFILVILTAVGVVAIATIYAPYPETKEVKKTFNYGEISN